jgi:hypothetical protein
MKKLFASAWKYSGWLVAGYTIYSQVKTMNTMKDELYSNLTPEEKAIWDRVTRAPKALLAEAQPFVVSIVPESIATGLEQLQAKV